MPDTALFDVKHLVPGLSGASVQLKCGAAQYSPTIAFGGLQVKVPPNSGVPAVVARLSSAITSHCRTPGSAASIAACIATSEILPACLMYSISAIGLAQPEPN